MITTEDNIQLKDNTVTLPEDKNIKRIMVVDDDPDITFSFKRVLENNGFLVHAYNDPLEALSEFKTKYYDLLLIDIRMPKLDGFELYNLLQKKDTEVKVCFMTAFESYYSAMKEEHPKLNARCFIKKPIEVNDLLSNIRNQLNITN
jgi:two-component system, OmpR family, response regulator ChvI